MQPEYLLRNRYRIEKALAAGGFGETYLAIDLDYPGQRQVVVKHLKPARQDPDTLRIAARLFESEAKALAEMGETSERIPMLYAYFQEQGQFYLVQEFISGITLTKELGSRQLSESQSLSIIVEILAGLRVVHGKKKIHRDLKPDNIIRRTSDQKLVLIDFGAVKEIRQASATTPNPSFSASIGIGTQGYMPTEQAIGFPRLASDIYSVGAIGIQCLTGQHPAGLFDDDILALRWRHLCSVSPELAMVLDKMVEQKHIDRYSDAIDTEMAIEQLSQSRSQSTLQPKPPAVKSPVSPPTPVAQSPKTNHAPPTKMAITSDGRRKMLKMIGFGGAGVAGSILLAQMFKNSSIPPTQEINVSTSSKNAAKPNDDGLVAGDSVVGNELIKFFPKSDAIYSRMISQEKQGFTEVKLIKDGINVAVLSIYDTANIPAAAQRYEKSTTNLNGYPLVDDESLHYTGVLINNHFVAKVSSRVPNFTATDRKNWLEKFDLDGLYKLK